MATHFPVDEGSVPGREFKETMRDLRKAWDRLRSLRGVLIARRGGEDGSDAAHYANHQAAYGYADNAAAKASFEEVDGNWSTVDAKIDQMLNRHL